MKRGITLIEVALMIAVLGVLAAITIPAFTSYLRRAEKAETANSHCSDRPLIEIYSEKQLDSLAREYAINKGYQNFVDRVELRYRRLLKVQDLDEFIHINIKTDYFTAWVREKCPEPERQKDLATKDLQW